jgi:hypothetical protein
MLRRQAGRNFEVTVGVDADLGTVHPPRVGIAKCADAPAAQTWEPDQGSFKDRPLLRSKTGHAQPQNRLLGRDVAHVRGGCHRNHSSLFACRCPGISASRSIL